MRPPRPALYLARASYRRRRAMDAARLLPILGVLLFWLPRLWGGEAGAEPQPGAATAREGVYLFAVWAGLVAAAAALSRGLPAGPDAEGAPDPQPDPPPHPDAGPGRTLQPAAHPDPHARPGTAPGPEPSGSDPTSPAPPLGPGGGGGRGAAPSPPGGSAR